MTAQRKPGTDEIRVLARRLHDAVLLMPFKTRVDSVPDVGVLHAVLDRFGTLPLTMLGQLDRTTVDNLVCNAISSTAIMLGSTGFDPTRFFVWQGEPEAPAASFRRLATRVLGRGKGV